MPPIIRKSTCLTIHSRIHREILEYLAILGFRDKFLRLSSQPAFTCSNLTIETLEQGVKYFRS